MEATLQVLKTGRQLIVAFAALTRAWIDGLEGQDWVSGALILGQLLLFRSHEEYAKC